MALANVKVPLARRVCVRVCRGGGRWAGIIVVTEASVARRSDLEHVRLGIEAAETRLPTGLKGALQPLPPVRPVPFQLNNGVEQPLPSPPRGRGGEGQNALRCMEGTLRMRHNELDALRHPAPPRPAPPRG